MDKALNTRNDTYDDSLTRISATEKEDLLNFTQETQGLSKFDLILSFGVLFLVLSIFIPKIYLSNNIYYVGREVSRLQAEKSLLHDEKIRLQKQIEEIMNKHRLLELGR